MTLGSKFKVACSLNSKSSQKHSFHFHLAIFHYSWFPLSSAVLFSFLFLRQVTWAQTAESPNVKDCISTTQIHCFLIKMKKGTKKDSYSPCKNPNKISPSPRLLPSQNNTRPLPSPLTMCSFVFSKLHFKNKKLQAKALRHTSTWRGVWRGGGGEGAGRGGRR